ncbi:MAG: AGE family epimerase/isomerase, partial [Spirochaeta sp.]|nr:AGE family epimerase/isomerase [Spirochaeta sp.]
VGLEYAERVFDLVQINCTETAYGGYVEMFERDWTLCGPGAGGGDRKTLDVHMHLMEAYTSLYAVSRKELHARKLREVIRIIVERVLSPGGTGVPQFTIDWKQAPHIKFDIVWGWDRYDESGQKANPLDNTSYGHNAEMAWLLLEALNTLGDEIAPYDEIIRNALDHAVRYGIDETYGGVYVEGSHKGPATDQAKEFWQQAETLIGMLDGFLRYQDDRYLQAYTNVHRFVMDTVIHHETGEWWPLLSREGEPIWRHMSHSWKVNYHTVRAAVNTVAQLQQVLDRNLV